MILAEHFRLREAFFFEDLYYWLIETQGMTWKAAKLMGDAAYIARHRGR